MHHRFQNLPEPSPEALAASPTYHLWVSSCAQTLDLLLKTAQRDPLDALDQICEIKAPLPPQLSQLHKLTMLRIIELVDQHRLQSERTTEERHRKAPEKPRGSI